jgi:hypothetical protein
MTKTAKPEAPTVDLAAQLEADAQAQAQAQAEAEQLERERKAVEAMAKGDTAAVAVAAVETEEERIARVTAEQVAARKAVGVRYYLATGDHPITDPETLKTFSNERPTKAEMTGWIEFQLANGKLAVDGE